MPGGIANFGDKRHRGFTSTNQPSREAKSRAGKLNVLGPAFLAAADESKKRNVAAKVRRQKRVLELIEQGRNIETACAEAGVRATTFYQWRKDPAFKAASEVARLEGRLENEKTGAAPVNVGRFTQSVRFRYRYFDHTTGSDFQAAIVRAVRGCPPGKVVIVTGPPGAGKGLALDTPVPTPTGWATMGELRVGDRIFAPDGNVTRVTAVSDVHHRPCFEVAFADGASLIADDEHLWPIVRKNRNYRPEVVSTQELHDSLASVAGPISVHHTQPLDPPDANLPIDPYVLGAWLGDGHSKAGLITTMDPEVLDGFRAAGYTVEKRIQAGKAATYQISRREQRAAALEAAVELVRSGWSFQAAADHCGVSMPCVHRAAGPQPGRHAGCQTLVQAGGWTPPKIKSLHQELREAGLLGNKHIPPVYLRASYKQRLALLRGIVDTDGFVDSGGHVSIGLSLPLLAAGVADLARGLGFKVYTSVKPTAGKPSLVTYFAPPPGADPVATVARKVERLALKRYQGGRQFRNRIVSVTPVPSVPTKCITVDHPSKCYLAGERYTPTHNTTTMVDLVCEDIARDPNWRGAYVHASKDKAKETLGQVKRRMEDGGTAPAFLDEFGPFKPETGMSKPWGAHELTVYKATHDEKDPTFQARGLASHIQGTRLNLLLVDDVQAKQTLQHTTKICDTLQQDFFTRSTAGKDTMAIVMVNSRVGERDVPSEMAKRLGDTGALHEWINIPAINAKTGESYDPVLWPMDKLMQQKARTTPEIWECCYMGQPQNAKVKTFPWTLLEGAKNNSRRIGQSSLPFRVAGLDPNIGGGSNVITVCGYDAERFDPIFQQEDKALGRVEQILAIIDATHRAHWFTDLVIERNYFQQGLAYDERLISWGNQRGVTIHTHTTGSNKYDDTIGIASMAGTLTHRQMDFPWADNEARAMFQPCLEQFEAWRPDVPAKHRIQDRVVSVWFPWIWWQARREMLNGADMESWGFAGLSYTPTAGAGLWVPRSA